MGHSELTAIVRAFEKAWELHLRDGRPRPDLSAKVDSVEASKRLQLLEMLLPVELERSLATKRPAELTDLTGRFPELESVVRTAFAEFSGSQDTLPPLSPSDSAKKPSSTEFNQVTIGHSSSIPGANATSGKSTPGVGQRFGDFEIIEEIARGGMGVVFRARETKLGRDCALKMILSGQFAGELEVQRFYAEAQAAANLEHPGIVPIYEIGRVDNLHFFSMKYVDGGSLADQLEELRSDPKRGVELIEAVARAVHFAHQRGILHRDLKPANILMESDGTPLVADLGLAKNTKADSGMTRTGAIVGTPAYMSPEQASGSPDITTAADIYSLGAMLYEILVGSAPHIGSTPMETILKVLNETPSSLRSMDSKIDRNIELICNKCLAKDPKQRYSSAAALADDLRCWLDGKPISLRPPNAAAMFSDWLKQNMRSVVGAGLTGLLFGLMLGVTVWITIADDSVPQFEEVYMGFPGETRPSLMIDPGIGKWFADNPTLFIIPAILFVGLATTLVTRPESRRSSVMLGTLAGLVMSMTAFATGIGWGPLLQKTLLDNRQDIVLLGEAASEDEQMSTIAQRSLVRKYPDLNSVSPKLRSRYVALKLMADGTMAIPIALWLGMIASLICCMVPAVLGTVFSGQLLKRTDKPWKIVLPYVEVAALVSIFSVFMVLNFVAHRLGANITIPPWIWQVGLFGTLGLATWIAVKNLNWKYRILGHGAWIVGLLLYQGEVSRIDQTFQVATQLMADDRMEDAAVRFERLLANRSDDGLARYHAAVLHAWMGNQLQYESHAYEMLRRYSRSLVPTTAEQTAKVYLLMPSDNSELQSAIELVDYAILEGRDSRFLPYFQMARGLVVYRKEDFPNVAKWTDLAGGSMLPFVSETSGLIGAMANFKVNQQAGREPLVVAINRATDSIADFRPIGALSNHIVDRLYLDVILREAKRLLNR